MFLEKNTQTNQLPPTKKSIQTNHFSYGKPSKLYLVEVFRKLAKITEIKVKLIPLFLGNILLLQSLGSKGKNCLKEL